MDFDLMKVTVSVKAPTLDGSVRLAVSTITFYFIYEITERTVLSLFYTKTLLLWYLNLKIIMT